MIEAGPPEFTRPLPTDSLPASGRAFRITADPAEREALARRFRLLALDHLSVDGELAPRGRDGTVHLRARLVADVTMRCVVKLEPIQEHIDVAFERVFDPTMADEWSGGGAEVLLSSSDDVDREPLIDSMVDPASAAADQLGLELPQFPRSPGAVFTGFDPEPADGDDQATESGPFAGLAGLVRKSPDER